MKLLVLFLFVIIKTFETKNNSLDTFQKVEDRSDRGFLKRYDLTSFEAEEKVSKKKGKRVTKHRHEGFFRHKFFLKAKTSVTHHIPLLGPLPRDLLGGRSLPPRWPLHDDGPPLP